MQHFDAAFTGTMLERGNSMFSERKPSIDALKEAPVKFRYTVEGKTRRVLVDALTAKAILAVHGKADPKIKEKIETAIEASPYKLTKLAEICFKHVSF